MFRSQYRLSLLPDALCRLVQRRGPQAWLVLCVLGLTAWLFAEALFCGGLFAFRDAGHYYYPLLQLVADQWRAGCLPLWNPYENLGVPLAGNPTASAFYPAILLFVLPIGAAWAYRIYVIGHVLLAAWAMYRLARHWQAGPAAAALAAVSYAFGGNVLFQHCNVVFLVGAAWLPLCLLAMDRMIVQQRLGGAVFWAVALAMMTLGGNAEMAYHAVLLALFYWLWMGGPCGTGGQAAASPDWAVGSGIGNPGGAPKARASQRPSRLKSLGLLALGTIVAGFLAAVVVLPAGEFSRRSNRSISPVPRSLYELPGHLLAGHGDDRSDSPVRWSWGPALLGRTLSATHHEHVFQFSLPPCRVAEYVWPNLYGRMFPENRRWLLAIGGEQRIWAPTLYMGLLPFVLAISALRLRKGPKRQTWLSWVAVLSLVASFGYYGLGYLMEHAARAAGVDTSQWPIGAPLGGLYWLMTLVLPGYVYFRYPAKLLVITALALSLLAARGAELVQLEAAATGSSNSRRRVRMLLAVVAVVSAIGTAAVLLGKPLWYSLVRFGAADPLFGPLDAEGAFADLLGALVQAAAVAAAAWWLFRGKRYRGHVQVGMILLLVVDLALANRWLIACVPASIMDHKPALLTAMQRRASVGNEGRSATGANSADGATWAEIGTPVTGDCDRLLRVWRFPLWLPARWCEERSPERFPESIAWQRDTLWPRYNLPWKVAVLEAEGTMKPADYAFVIWVVRSRGQQAEKGLSVAGGRPTWPVAAASHVAWSGEAGWKTGDKPRNGSLFFLPLNVDYAILRENERVPGLEPAGDRPNAGNSAAWCSQWPEDAAVWRVVGALPRAWIVHRVRQLRPVATTDPAQIWNRTEQVFFPAGSVRNLLHEAVVEHCEPILADVEPMDRPASVCGEYCRVLRDQPCRVELDVQLQEPGLLVLCDQYWPGWEARVCRVEPSASASPRPVATEPGVPASPRPLAQEVGARGWQQQASPALQVGEGSPHMASPPRRVPVLRTNRVMRGVWLPEGRYRVQFVYRPASFRTGAALSGAAWLCVLAAAVCSVRARRRRQREAAAEAF